MEGKDQMDTRFHKSADTFYITRGWRCVGDANGKMHGSLFKFEIVKNGETLLLVFLSEVLQLKSVWLYCGFLVLMNLFFIFYG